MRENPNFGDAVQTYSRREPRSVQVSISQNSDNTSNYQLALDNKNGLIFSSSINPISGNVMLPEGNATLHAILIIDESSLEVARIVLRPERCGDLYKSSFNWDLKSKSNSYVKSGCYRISFAELADDEVIELCSLDCMVADTRVILSTTDSLKCSKRPADPAARRILSIYADIIRDIEIRIIEGLMDNRFDEPYFVARTTAGFIQQIYSDVENDSSQFRALIEEFVSLNPALRLQPNDAGLSLWTLFDFLVNYMADPEDQARATAMIKCKYRNFTANDRSVVLSALVSGIFPYCNTFEIPNNIIGRKTTALVEHLLKLGIRYVCAKHVDRSISICRDTIP